MHSGAITKIDFIFSDMHRSEHNLLMSVVGDDVSLFALNPLPAMKKKASEKVVC